jgi:hypothetical protein
MPLIVEDGTGKTDAQSYVSLAEATANVAAYVQDELYMRLWSLRNGFQRTDSWTPLATAAGGFISGTNSDAVHINAVGARLLVPDMEMLFQNRDRNTRYPLLAMTDTAAHALTWIANAISFTDSNADGVPDSWNAAGAGGTYSITAADSGDLGAWARTTMTAGTSVGLGATAVTLASLGWSIGDRLAIGYRIRSSAATITNTVNLTGVSVSTVSLFNEPGPTDRYVYHETTLTAGTVINISIVGTGTGWFEFSRPIVVNLTQMGLA